MQPTQYRERKLKTEAKQSAQFRGHRLSTFKRVHNHTTHEATCLDCGMCVRVNLKPAPNQIDIGGEAVALGCTGKPLPSDSGANNNVA